MSDHAWSSAINGLGQNGAEGSLLPDTHEQVWILGRLRTWLLALPRWQKRVFLVATDVILLATVVWAAAALRYQELIPPIDWRGYLLLSIAPLITVATFAWFGLYRLVTRFIGYRGTLRILGCVALSVLVWSLIVFMAGQLGTPRIVILTYGIASAIIIVASRQLAGLLLRTVGIKYPTRAVDFERKPVLIYGAGHEGVELLAALRRVSDREPVGFIDPDTSMWGQYLGGLKVYKPQKIGAVIDRAGVKEVLLAIPETHRRERRQIVADLRDLPVAVKVMPSMQEIASGRVSITDVRPLEVEDLLGRDPVPPNAELLARSIAGKSILVTGAGGSVGSELVRQILKQSPRRIVLLDISEVALYEIGMEVGERIAALHAADRPLVASVLGSVLDDGLVRDCLKTHGIETIYHAAAYKHVPIVEANPVVGLLNNTFGCAVIAEAARDLGVERFVLISTDKAVRPTNVMGATKRLAELVLQAHAAEGDIGTVFTMVRFGNVLDSSGSVVRRFRQQIASGGPVTVTHPEIIRYFMSIPEAAELVIQAGAMASGGEVFVLDMGEPVKIDDLARLMIRLAGLDVRDPDNPSGDIEVVYTGLRPGEKLYEELLIGVDTTGTEHPRILRSGEPFLTSEELWLELDGLSEAMKKRDHAEIEAMLIRTVEGYQPYPALATLEQDGQSWVPGSRTLH
ncbi:MAG: nucleoside-diphosphate sugar epimerase/dehydratase [Hyphomicrobiaceae bacterium]|nr:nucleoside-diphosphate sugar epimerase/dehydratase [Hyphomicrobiaceae bacterium]